MTDSPGFHLMGDAPHLYRVRPQHFPEKWEPGSGRWVPAGAGFTDTWLNSPHELRDVTLDEAEARFPAAFPTDDPDNPSG